MIAAKVFALAAFAVGAIAAPVAPESTAAAYEGKPFKIAFQIKGKTLYLSEKGDAVPAMAQGVTCAIQSQAIQCGSQKLGYTYNNSHTPSNKPLVPTSPAPLNVKWSIGPNDKLVWGAKSGGEVHFSTKTSTNNKIFAEICSTYGHGDKGAFNPHDAKAVFV